MADVSQPTGTITLVFSDIEGSTRLLHELGTTAYKEALAEHRRIVRECCARYSGYEVDYEGDAFFYAFSSAQEALSAISEAMQGLQGGPISTRVGIHTGSPELDPPKYVGLDVHTAARIMSAGHGGQVLVSPSTEAALPESTRLRQALTSLGSHRLKDVPEPLTLYQLGDGAFPPLKTLANSNLPTPASSFLGREAELREADELLRSTRLLTIAGPGGQGKTRFALELARRSREERFSDYQDGVFSSFFASLRDPALVLPTIAHTLSLQEQPGQSALDTLASHLEGKRMLLLLDNLEHLLEAAPELSELLERAPGLTLLVTSRELLRLRGETTYLLPPLPEEDGVALFCERARVEPSPEIHELALRLEGLPLAIELAAARLAILTPAQLLERLSKRLDLLKGTRDADPRQQTLRATIEWSYDLLSDEEQRLFRTLSVFAGGCTLEAAEEVAGADLDTLQSLVDKSLLRFTEERFWMLETLREYAGEKLGEEGEAEALRERHADFFLALAEELEPPQIGGLDDVSMARLLTETDNLRGALAHFAAHPDPTRELRVVGALFRFWEGAGVAEGRRVFEHAYSRRREDDAVTARALYAGAICAYHTGDFATLERLETERLAIAERLGDDLSVAVALNDLAVAADELGDTGRARDLFRRAAAVAESLGETSLLVGAASNLAQLEIAAGDAAGAIEMLEPLLLDVRAHEDPWLEAHVLVSLGLAALYVGEPGLARDWYRTALGLGPARPLHVALASLRGLSTAAVDDGSFLWAARVLGAARAIAQASKLTGLDSIEARLVERTEVVGRAALGVDEWEAGVSEGAAMTLDEAVAYALEDPVPSGK